MLISSVLLILTSNAVTLRRDKSILYARVVITILLCCFLLCFNSYYIEFQNKGLGLFSGLFHVTANIHIFHMFIMIITAVILLLNAFHSWTVHSEKSIAYLLSLKERIEIKGYKISKHFEIIEYPLIILFALIGAMFLISSYDLISVFLSIELQSYGLYILCAVYRNSERATSGALTYFLLGGLSSCFILLGSALLYSNSGNTSFDGLYVINNISNVSKYVYNTSDFSLSYLKESYYFNLSLVIISVGFLFKISAAPFHNWSPDVYDNISTVVTTFVAVFAKISILVLLLEIIHYTTKYTHNDTVDLYMKDNNIFNYPWTFSILISSFLSLIIGSILGLTQVRVKRLYAYSTISHIGFLLLALTINSLESIQAFIFYLMQYSLSNLNAFFILLSIGYYSKFYFEKKQRSILEESTNMVTSKEDSPIQYIIQMKGYFYCNPVLTISLALTLFSFVGIPPLIGFFAKQMILTSALDNGYVFMSIVAILTSVISAYYYLFVIRQMFFVKSDFRSGEEKGDLTEINSNESSLGLSSSLSITISIITLITSLFILTPQEWLNMANILAVTIFN